MKDKVHTHSINQKDIIPKPYDNGKHRSNDYKVCTSSLNSSMWDKLSQQRSLSCQTSLEFGCTSNIDLFEFTTKSDIVIYYYYKEKKFRRRVWVILIFIQKKQKAIYNKIWDSLTLC